MVVPSLQFLRAGWVLWQDEKLSEEERQELDMLRVADDEVAQAVMFAQTFTHCEGQDHCRSEKARKLP